MTLNFSRPLHWNKKFIFVAKKQGDKVMRIEYDTVFIKLLAKEVVKEMQKVKSEVKEPELITVKEAAETLNLSEDYVRKIKDKLPHVKQGNSKQGRLLFVKEGLMEAYLNSK